MIIWTKKGCTYCEYAKTLMQVHDIQYEERVLGEGWTKEQLLEAVPNAKTVPQIFDGDTLIGGYEDLSKKLRA